MSCVALSATLMVDLKSSELLQQRGLSLWDMRFLCPDQNNFLYLCCFLLPGHLLHYGNKASTKTPEFLSGTYTLSVWKAVLLLHMFSSEMMFSVPSENTVTSFHSCHSCSPPILLKGGYPMPSWDVCIFLFNIFPHSFTDHHLFELWSESLT